MVSCRDAAYDHHEDFDKCQRSWFQMQQTYHNLNLATPKDKQMVDKVQPQKWKDMLGSP